MGPALVGAVIGALVGLGVQLGVEYGMGTEAGWLAVVIGAITGGGAYMMAGEAIKKVNYARGALTALIALAAIVGASHASSALIRQKNVSEAEEQTQADLVESIERDVEEGNVPSIPGIDDVDLGDPAGDADESESDAEETADDTEADESTEDDASEETSEADGDADTGDEESDTDEEPADSDSDEADEQDNAGETDREPVKKKLALEDADAAAVDAELDTSWWQFAFFAIGTFLAYEFARGGGSKE